MTSDTTLSEQVDLNDTERTIWQKIVDAIREFLIGRGMKMSDKDIESLIRESYRNLKAINESKIGKGVELQRVSLSLDRGNPAFKRATEDVMKKLEATGVKVKVLTKEEAESELARLEELADMQKRTAPETVSVQDEHLQTVVSSADVTKVLKDLDSAIKEYDENANKRLNTFLGDVAKVLGATKQL